MPIQTTGSPKSVKFYHNGNLLPADAAGQIKITKVKLKEKYLRSLSIMLKIAIVLDR